MTAAAARPQSSPGVADHPELVGYYAPAADDRPVANVSPIIPGRDELQGHNRQPGYIPSRPELVGYHAPEAGGREIHEAGGGVQRVQQRQRTEQGARRYDRRGRPATPRAELDGQVNASAR